MVEPEMAFATLDDLMGLAEQFLSLSGGAGAEPAALDLKVIGRDTTKLEAVRPPFPRLSYDEALRMLTMPRAA
jgi:asparaginyl-tRNA synthetase